MLIVTSKYCLHTISVVNSPTKKFHQHEMNKKRHAKHRNARKQKVRLVHGYARHGTGGTREAREYLEHETRETGVYVKHKTHEPWEQVGHEARKAREHEENETHEAREYLRYKTHQALEHEGYKARKARST